VNPAPTLLNDWLTTPGFLAILAILAILIGIGLGMVAAEILRGPDEEPEPAPQPHECSITDCHQPATHAWPTGITGVTYYACGHHTPMVRGWAGPYDRTVETIYNQELDGIEDYANGEAS
jgi:hypothetical protein